LDLGRKQVVLLGDSVAWGYGVGDADTLSYILEPGLKPHGVQLSNLAVSGYGFDQYLLRLQENLPLLSKQLAGIVLIICAQNDYQNTIRNSIFGKRKMLFRQRGADIQLTDWPVSRYSLRNLLSDSFIITKASDASESFRNAIHSIAGDIELTEPEAKIVVLSVLRKIIEVARDLRVPMTIILSPDRLDFPEPRSRYVNFQNVLDEAGISYIDYRRVIQEKGFNVSGIYHDRLHYTPEGNRYLADVVRERLSEAGVIPHGG
jgi:lysophospholipase L1-like esterase